MEAASENQALVLLEYSLDDSDVDYEQMLFSFKVTKECVSLYLEFEFTGKKILHRYIKEMNKTIISSMRGTYK